MKGGGDDSGSTSHQNRDEGMSAYYTDHPSSPAAMRCPASSFRRGLWTARLGPSVEEGIVGVGFAVEAARRTFDTQYLAGLRSPSEAIAIGHVRAKVIIE